MNANERELLLNPVFGICGHSGSGKTTLILKLLRRLRARGLNICVVKHDAHGLDLDREGKDSDRFFRAGADVLIRDPEQICLRARCRAGMPPLELLAGIGPYFDLILVEGYKTAPLDMKIWLCGDGEDAAPPGAINILRTLKRDEDRVEIALRIIDRWLPDAWRAPPVYAGILIGGASSRMGRSKHLIEHDGQTWLHRSVAAVRNQADRVVILGGGDVPADLRSLPVLPDADDADGPLRGMRAAMRWAPRAGWLFVACDQPDISGAAVAWLLDRRRPGTRAIMPRLPGRTEPEPLFAYYDYRMGPVLERVRRPIDLAATAGVEIPAVPDRLSGAWRNRNRPEDIPA